MNSVEQESVSSCALKSALSVGPRAISDGPPLGIQPYPGHHPSTAPWEGTRVLIVEDHLIIAQCLELILKPERDLVGCGRTGTGPEVIRAVETCWPDVLLVGIDHNPVRGLSVVQRLVRGWPCLPILVVGSHDDIAHARCAFELGASGCLSGSEEQEAMCSALRQVAHGHRYCREDWRYLILDEPGEGPPPKGQRHKQNLTRREWQMVHLLAEGWEVSEIAPRLSLTPKTVSSHCRSAARKLDLGNATRLRLFAPLLSGGPRPA